MGTDKFHTGIVKFFDEKKGFGWIVDDKTKLDVHVHYRDIVTGETKLEFKQKVAFQVMEDFSGPKAFNVKIIKEAPVPINESL